MQLQRVSRRSVADDVFEQLRDGVLSGEIGAGESLPAERALTAALGVNRQAVREALQRLAATGLIEIRHGGRTLVSDYRRSAGLELLPRLLLGPNGQIDTAVALSILELRSCLGPDVARCCAQRAEPAAIARIDRLVADMAAADDDLHALVLLDLQLWDAMVDASENIAYRLAFNTLRRTYEPIAEVLTQPLAAELRDHAGRRVVATAIAAGDETAAAAATQRLLQRGEQGIRQLLTSLAADGTGADR